MIVQSKCGLFRAIVEETPEGTCEVRYEHRFATNGPHSDVRARWQYTRTVQTGLPFHASLLLASAIVRGE